MEAAWSCPTSPHAPPPICAKITRVSAVRQRTEGAVTGGIRSVSAGPPSVDPRGRQVLLASGTANLQPSKVIPAAISDFLLDPVQRAFGRQCTRPRTLTLRVTGAGSGQRDSTSVMAVT